LSKARVDQLGLEPMSRANGTRHETAFTTRSRRARASPPASPPRPRAHHLGRDRRSKGREDIVTPGHVFPLTARDGGVLVRAGHTEAAVDVSRLAGLNPSGVICEILREDGTMARLDDLIPFAQLHGLKIGTIRDLIAYRLREDRLIEQTAEARFDSCWGGGWSAKSFFNKAGGQEHVALVKGQSTRAAGAGADARAGPGRRHVRRALWPRRALAGAMRQIGEHGSGVVVVINRNAPGSLSRALRSRAGEAVEPDTEALRDYGVGAQILAALGVHEMILLTNTHHTPVALAGYGLSIVEERPIPMEAN
jgi:3,4-dihydroxy 2-butanone 4-phosphate synthase/GTP cyclohydrolase II